MIKRVLTALSAALPDVKIIPPYQRKRERCVIYRVYPGKGNAAASHMRLELRFVAPSLAEARRMLLAANRAIVSDGDRAKVGKGVDAVLVEKIAEGGGSGYIIKTGLYFIKAGYALAGYDGNGGSDE